MAMNERSRERPVGSYEHLVGGFQRSRVSTVEGSLQSEEPL